MTCRIMAAAENGAHILRLEGDVRLTMCTALDDYFARIFADPDFVSVWVDLTRATGLDSTTLGMLAQLALKTHERFGFKPAVFSTNAGINRLLHSMGFQQLFDLHDKTCAASTEAIELPSVESGEEEVKARVLAAHKTLMALSKDNYLAFKDLVSALEKS